MIDIAAVLGFGFLGACLRHVLSAVISSRIGGSFPSGIFVVNMTGSFALGLLTGLAVKEAWPAWVATGLGVGAIGAYTTYSTWANDSVNLWRNGRRVSAVVNVAGSIVLGVTLATLGIAVANVL